MSRRYGQLVIGVLLVFLAPTGRAAPPSPKDAVGLCTRNLQAIGRALTAYRRATGRLPNRLSDLYPKYLNDKALFHCPSDSTAGQPSYAASADPRLPISYLYEFSLDKDPGGFLMGPGPSGPAVTWREQKLAQRLFFGDRVPVVRCWHHNEAPLLSSESLVLNLTLSGLVYTSVANWELDPATLPVVLAAMERDLAAGPQQFRRRWHPVDLTDYLDNFTQPIPALRTQLHAVALKLSSLAQALTGVAATDMAAAAASLARIAGDDTPLPPIGAAAFEPMAMSGRPTLALQIGHSAPIVCVAVSPDGKTLATGSLDNTARLWELQTGRLKAILRGHTGSILQLTFSPDGEMLATSSLEDRTVRLWDARRGQPRAVLTGLESPTFAFAPDSAIFAISTADRVELWDLRTGQRTAILRPHLANVLWLYFCPDGKTLLAVSQYDLSDGGGSRWEQSYELRVWDVPSRRLRTILRGRQTAAGPMYPVKPTLAVSPDGKTLALGGNPAQLWDIETGKQKATLQSSTVPVLGILFSPDGKTLATSAAVDWYWARSRGRKVAPVRLWNGRTGRLNVTLPVDEAPVAFSPDGKTLATEDPVPDSLAEKIGLRIAPPELSARLGSSAWLLSLLLYGRWPAVHLWDVSSGQLKTTLYGARRPVAFSPDGKQLVTGINPDDSAAPPIPVLMGSMWAGAPTHTLRVWNVETGQPISAYRGRLSDIQAVALSPDGSMLATGRSDAGVHLWDLSTGQLSATLSGHKTIVMRLAFSTDGNRLASSEQVPGTLAGDPSIVPYRNEVRIWDVRRGKPLVSLQGLKSPVSMLLFSPDGKTLATGARTMRREQGNRFVPLGEAQLWDTSTGQQKVTLEGPLTDGQPPVLAFSPDGSILATGWGQWQTFDPKGKRLITRAFGAVRLSDTSSGQLKATLTGHTAPIRFLTFSPDGRLLATGSSDGTTRLWDIESGRPRAVLSGSGWADMIAFSPDGTRVATGRRYGDGTIRLWDARTGQLETALRGQSGLVQALAFSPDGKTLATRDGSNQVRLWDVGTGKQVPLTVLSQLAHFPLEIARPTSSSETPGQEEFPLLRGEGTSLYDPRDGKVLATMLPAPDVAAPDPSHPHAQEVDARPIEVGARPAPATDSGEWFITTPEGYFDCSANAARFILWNVNGVLYPAERYARRFRRPDLVRKALGGERITAPELSANDIPPSAQFIGLKNGDPAPADPLTVIVEARDDGDVKEVELLVNGRPLPPEQARPIEVGAKPIEVGAKEGGPPYRVAKRFTYRFSLPLGAREIHLRAIAYDTTDLGSDPVEIVLKRAGIPPVTGNLYVLAVGVSRYQNTDGQHLRDLQFPAADAQAIAQRFQREGRPLYEQAQVRIITDEQATLANVRAGLKWLQESVRPGQVDTVVLFLSGHGISIQEGRYYYFATHDLDLQNVAGTSLSGRELRAALGGRLTAKTVFLFVDTCHAGGLSGRNDDLAQEVGEGVYILASSGARESSYESPTWEHGAFTLALLRSLNRRELAPDGAIRFNALAYAVPDAVAELMKAAGRNESEQEPCVPLAARRLRVPIAQPAR